MRKFFAGAFVGSITGALIVAIAPFTLKEVRKVVARRLVDLWLEDDKKDEPKVAKYVGNPQRTKTPYSN